MLEKEAKELLALVGGKENVNQLVQTMRPYVTSSMKNLEEITDKLNAVMDSITNQDGVLGSLIKDKEMKEQVKQSVGELKETMTEVKSFVGRMSRFRVYWDYDFFYRQYTANRAFAYIPIPVAVYDAESGISSTQYMKLYKENAEISGRDGSALWRFQCAMVQVKALLKKILPGQLVLNKKQVKQEKS